VLAPAMEETMSETAVVAPAESPEATPEGQATEVVEPDEKALGDAGKKALTEERAARKAAEKKVQEAESKAAAVLAKLEGREAEWSAEQERKEAITEALAKRDSQIVQARLEAAATGKLADPADAALYVDTKDFEVSETGTVDTEAMSAAIADLIERKPHLAARGGSATPRPDPSQGTSGGVGKRTTGQLFAAAIEGKK